MIFWIEKEEKFNGIILKNNDPEIIFCFYIKLQTETKKEFDYLLTLGTIQSVKNQLTLVIAKFHYKNDQKTPMDINKIEFRR